MKKLIIVIFASILFTANSYSQVVGQFRYLEDERLYLVFQNQSMYTFNAVGSVYRNNMMYNSETLTLEAGSAFMLGPSTPWKWQWQIGDTYVLTYPNGQSVSWTCQIDDVVGLSDISFGKHKIWYGEGTPSNPGSDGYINSQNTIELGGYWYHVYHKNGSKYVFDKKYGWCKI